MIWLSNPVDREPLTRGWVALVLSLSLVVWGQTAAGQAAIEPPPDVIRSAQSGNWSSPDSWAEGRVPQAGDRVLIRQGHAIRYDGRSDEVIRGICVAGSLVFATDRDTVLNVGLIRIAAGDVYTEHGFDCNHPPQNTARQDADGQPAGSRAALIVGTKTTPLPAEHRAVIRLHHVAGMDPETCPAILCCGGQMDFHGAPLKRTWVKLSRTADAGATRLFLSERVDDWRVGDRLLITGSGRQEFPAGTATAHVNQAPASELRTIERLSVFADRVVLGSPQLLQIDEPLQRTHTGGDEYCVEVANLSRNVVVESADPDGVRGHTMYHRGSSGSISYAEFRHLGKQGILGKYPIHFHLVGDTMRGSSVIGAAIWDSHNRWVAIHGTQYLLLRDCVGYQSIGHGFFLEDGTEVFNVLDRNLAVQAMIGQPLPDQSLPFDLNDGAGFWWANSCNSFTRNVAVECDQYGFRFEAEQTDEFDPVVAVRQPSGKVAPQDIRTLPFIRFADNEAHCQRRFGFNFGGIRGMTHETLRNPIKSSAYYPSSVGGTVDGIGPDEQHPFQVQNMKVWDAHWALHSGIPALSVDGLDVYDCNYGIWRSMMDLHQYANISFRQIHSHAIFFPTGGTRPGIHMDDGRPFYPATRPVDDFPPITLVTDAIEAADGTIRVSGVAVDNGTIDKVYINGAVAAEGNSGLVDWTFDVSINNKGEPALSVFAVDEAGNTEQTPHQPALIP